MLFSRQDSPALALANMDEDDPRFQQALSCGDDPPPPYRSDESTEFPSAEPSDHGQHEAHETVERLNSTVYYQFQHQKCDEEEQLRRQPVRGPFDFDQVATATVIRCWTEQGIWNNKWDPQNLGLARWKHEESSELDPGPDPNSPSPPPIFGKRPKRAKDRQRTSRPREQSAREKAEREASRPCHQFHYQVLKEREHIGATTSDPTKAYENVKQRWIDRGIWDTSWLRLPGMSWKHEKPWRYETVNTPQHARVEAPAPLDGTALAPALHVELHDALRYSLAPQRRLSDPKLLRDGKQPGKEAPVLTRVSDASKAIKKQSSRTSRRTGDIQHPLRRSERIRKRDQKAQVISAPPALVKAATSVEAPKSKRRMGSTVSLIGATPRGIAKRARKPSR
ncbi:MAG: hypothetical protein Q9210_002541 [Variospora velana]